MITSESMYKVKNKNKSFYDAKVSVTVASVNTAFGETDSNEVILFFSIRESMSSRIQARKLCKKRIIIVN